MINGNFTLARAKSLAARIGSSNVDETVEKAYGFLFGRNPTTREREAAGEFLQSQKNRIDDHAIAGHASLASKMPQREGNAAVIDPKLPETVLRMADGALPTGDFTIEADVLFHSLAGEEPDRTIAAQWDGDKKSSGWALSVAGARSASKPGNLILELSSDASADGNPKLCDSELTLKVDCAYYVAAVVSASDAHNPGVTFYVKDLSDNDAPLLTKRVAGPLPSCNHATRTFTVGGLDGAAPRAWDGLIDDVRFSAAPLSEQQLLWQNGSAGEACLGFWKFEETPGFEQDSSGKKHHLTESKSATKHGKGHDPRAALIDFCHVLLNSSEFLYVD